MPGNMMRSSVTARSSRSPEKPGVSRTVSGRASTTPSTTSTPVSAQSRPATAPASRPASSPVLVERAGRRPG